MGQDRRRRAMPMATVVTAVGLLLAVTLLASPVPASAEHTASATPGGIAACSLAPTGGRVTRTVVGGRTYRLYVPAGITASTAPLVVSLHGWGGNPDAHADAEGLDVFADRYKVIVAYPAGVVTPLPFFGLSSTGWDYRWQASADITFLRTVVADVTGSYCVNPRRVHADGLSMGGPMSQRLACEASDVFASVNSTVANDVAAPWRDGLATFPSQPCNTDRPIAVYHSCGAADPFTGEGCRQAAETWAARNGCTSFTTVTDTYGEARVYAPCAAGTRVVWRNWAGHFHSYLSGAQRDQWFTELNLFFAAHPRP